MPLIVEFNKVTAWAVCLSTVVMANIQCVFPHMTSDMCAVCVCVYVATTTVSDSASCLACPFAAAVLLLNSLWLLLMWTDMSISDMCMRLPFGVSVVRFQQGYEHRIETENAITHPRITVIIIIIIILITNAFNSQAFMYLWRQL